MYARVLVPLDGSSLAERALLHAERLVAPGGELVLVQVVEPSVAMPPGAFEIASAGEVHRLAAALRDAVERPIAAAERYLSGARGRIARTDIAVTTRAVPGDTVDRLVEAARKADLVVMSTHGRTGLAHLLLGSVAERLVRRAPVPVLVVRGFAEATNGEAEAAAAWAAGPIGAARGGESCGEERSGRDVGLRGPRGAGARS